MRLMIALFDAYIKNQKVVINMHKVMDLKPFRQMILDKLDVMAEELRKEGKFIKSNEDVEEHKDKVLRKITDNKQ